jgi:hypothetical protein
VLRAATALSHKPNQVVHDIVVAGPFSEGEETFASVLGLAGSCRVQTSSIARRTRDCQQDSLDQLVLDTTGPPDAGATSGSGALGLGRPPALGCRQVRDGSSRHSRIGRRRSVGSEPAHPAPPASGTTPA